MKLQVTYTLQVPQELIDLFEDKGEHYWVDKRDLPPDLIDWLAKHQYTFHHGVMVLHEPPPKRVS